LDFYLMWIVMHGTMSLKYFYTFSMKTKINTCCIYSLSTTP